MQRRCTHRTARLAAAVALGLLAVAPCAEAGPCGDVNGSNSVTASDALAVLRKSVGMNVALTCSGDCATLDPRVTTLEDTLAATQAALAEMQDLFAAAQADVASLKATLAGVSRSGNTIVVSGANLQVVDGSGSTSGPTNGLGNVIIGYNEKTGSQPRTGSHNLVVGQENGYSSFGSIVGGEFNLATARGASVLGGSYNTASGLYATVAGGSSNTASGQNAAAGGGYSNLSSGSYASVAAGCESTASNNFSAICGGQKGTASGAWAAVTGGYGNRATASHSAVGGGNTRTAGQQYNWVAGSLLEAQ